MAVAKTNAQKSQSADTVKPVATTETKTTEVVATPEKTEEKKTAEVNVEPEKKTAAKKTTTRKKASAKKGAKRGPKPAAERTVELHVQFGGKEVSYTDLVNRIKEMWKEQGKRETSMKSLNIYVKPDEFKAYYVINEEITGEIDF
ncbi:MAG: hypothetical protein HFG35_04500 [Eubacterium sp.]|jgi:hypothetical protein|nr:hypothetical protein [Eubacterium sp.]